MRTTDWQARTADRSTELGDKRVRAPEYEPIAVPALTIACHPMVARIGERALLSELLAGREASVSRVAPLFAQPGGGVGMPLRDTHISRAPIVLRRRADGVIVLDAGSSRTELAVNGERIEGSCEIAPGALGSGIVITLGTRVVLVLHEYIEPAGMAARVKAAQDRDDLGLVGASAAIARVRDEVRRAAAMDIHVLIRGETGTGKELVANALHRLSLRRERPLISISLAAIPKTLAASELFGAKKGAFTGASQAQDGYFRRAHGATLFLDELGEASVDVQVMLLRALETGEIARLGEQRAERLDVRVIAATDADLNALAASGHFREPLLYRLAGYEVNLPPLRERRDDIARLLVHFLREDLAALGDSDCLDRDRQDSDAEQPWLSAEVVSRLVRYDWPGNVRELRNAARQCAIASHGRPVLCMPDLWRERLSLGRAPAPGPDQQARQARQARQDSPATGQPRRAASDAASRRKPSDISESELASALEASRWDVARAARVLGVPRSSIYDMMARSDLVRPAGAISAGEILACHGETGGNLDAMVERLRISKAALRRRLRELGLA